MTDIISKQGSIRASEEDVFAFLTDLRNLEEYIPTDKVKNWEADEEQCSFSIPKVGEITLRISEKTPHKLIKVEPVGGASPFSFSFFIQMKQLEEADTRIKLTLRAELNMMMKTMFKGPIKKGLDQIVDTLSGFQVPPRSE